MIETYMKTILFVLLLTTEVSTCFDKSVVIRMQETSKKTEEICLARGGVPIYQINHNTNDDHYFETVARCDFPPHLQLEK